MIVENSQGTPATADGESARPNAHSALRSVAPRIRAMILLAGSVRESQMSRALGRSMLDLPLGSGRTILGAWVHQAAVLAEVGGIRSLPVRVLLTRRSSPPAAVPDAPGTRVSLESDREELRGTGGLLRDLADDYGPNDLLLVANAHQVVVPSLADLTDALAGAMGDVALLATPQHAPCGLELLRCGALRAIKARGFIDLKEQALPAIAAAYQVRVVVRGAGAVVAVRTLEGYLGALRALHATPGVESADPMAEDWFPTFGLVEDAANVAPSARVHDSVVLRGASVATGATVVRSLVCEGGVVGPDEVVADRIVVGPHARGAERAR